MPSLIDTRILDRAEPLPWPDVTDVPPLVAEIDRAAVVNGMTERGRPAVVLIGTLSDGRPVLLHTTSTLFEMLAAANRRACLRWGTPNW